MVLHTPIFAGGIDKKKQGTEIREDLFHRNYAVEILTLL